MRKCNVLLLQITHKDLDHGHIAGASSRALERVHEGDPKAEALLASQYILL